MGSGERHEAVVGPGVPVWSVVGYLKLFDWNIAKVMDEFGGVLTREDVEAAWSYYKEHGDEIDLKLRLNEFAA